MSTRGLIAIEEQDGTCRAIYCHHDMYPEWAGSVLPESYKTKEEVEALIALGDLSSVDETLEECYAYHRDGGEALKEARSYEDRQKLAEAANKGDPEYVYLFASGTWLCYSCRKKSWSICGAEIENDEND